MVVRYQPKRGQIVWCDYSRGFVEPEMVKRRPAVVIAHPMASRPGLTTVVPMSGTKPNPVKAYNHNLILPQQLPYPFENDNWWVACDMIAAVSLDRLFLPHTGTSSGKRKYLTIRVSAEDMGAIELAIMASLDIKIP